MRVAWCGPLLLVAIAGCLTDEGTPIDEAPGAPVATGSVLVGALEPGVLEAPTFHRLGAIAAGGPVYGAGEPSIWAALDGTLYVAFPGCDRGFYLVSLPTPGAEDCQHGLLYATADDGATWMRLNRDGDGRYEDGGEGPAANGDADVAVDADGTIYASNLGGGIQVHRSLDGGATWEYMADVVPEDEGSDRQWMAAAGPGHLIMTWMRTSPNRDVAINTTFDGGLTWTGESNFGDGIGWLGTVQFAPDGQHAYLPYTKTIAPPPGIVLGGGTYEMRVLRTADGGLSWDDVSTGWTWGTTMTGGHWSGGHMAPSMDVTGDGTLVVAFSIDDSIQPQRSLPYATNYGASVFVVTSADGGDTWTAPWRVPMPTETLPINLAWNAIMPWVTGGAGDRYALTYYYNEVLLDSDYFGETWDVRATVVDNATAREPTFVHAVIDSDVHVGGLCSRGSGCLLTGSDRALLDFFEADLLPDGRLAVTYPADPLTGGKYIEIRVAIQDGGTLLLERTGPDA